MKDLVLSLPWPAPFVAVALGALGCNAASGSSPADAPWCAGLGSQSVIVDLSHAYDETTIFWPTEVGFLLEKEFDGVTAGGYYYSSNKLSTPEHGGTHIDAPVHFARGRSTVERIPLDHLL